MVPATVPSRGPDMAWYWWLVIALAAALLGLGGGLLLSWWWGQRRQGPDPRRLLRRLLARHFRPAPLDDLTISERRFPFRVRADLQRAIDQLFSAATVISHFCGVRKE